MRGRAPPFAEPDSWFGVRMAPEATEVQLASTNCGSGLHSHTVGNSSMFRAGMMRLAAKGARCDRVVLDITAMADYI